MARGADGGRAAVSPGERPEGLGRFDLFVSYSRRDAAFVARLTDRLGELGKKAWVDSSSIPPGTDWSRELSAGIDAADTFVFVVTPDAATSPYCRDELSYAGEQGKRITPVLRRDADDLPAELASRQFVDMRDEAAFEAGLAALVRALDTDLEWARGHTHWLEEAQRWDGHGRDTTMLLRGTDLTAAESWLTAQTERKEPRPTELQSRFIALSRQRATRRLRLTLTAVLAVAVLAVALSVVAVVQRQNAIHQRDLAQSRELAAKSASLLGVQPRRAIYFARRAVEIHATPEAEFALRRAMASRTHSSIFGNDGDLSGTTLAFSPDGKLVALGDENPPVQIWSLARRRLVAQLPHSGSYGVAFSKDGSRLLLTAGAGVRYWDFRHSDHSVALSYLIPEWAVGFTADDTLAVTVSELNSFVVVWDVARRKRAYEFWTQQSVVLRPSLSPDGERIVTPDSAGTVQVWDIARRKQLALLPGHSGSADSADFSADGRLVVSTGEDGTVRVWDWAKKRLLATLRGHDGPVTTAAFSPDGQRVVSAGAEDKTIRVWTWANGDSIVLPGHPPEYSSYDDVAFTPDGRGVIAVESGGLMRVWTCPACGPLDDLVRLAREAFPKEPSPPRITGEVVTPRPPG